MIKAKYNPDWDLLGYDINVNESQLNEIFDWAREKNLRNFVVSLGTSVNDYNKPFVIRIPTCDLALEFLLIFDCSE